MELQKLVDSFEGITCIISVEKKSDGSCGEIRIKAGNAAFIKNIETPYPGAPKIVFVPDSPYMTFLPKDLNFEDMCYRSAILKQPRHTYVHPERYPLWFNIYTMPLASDDDSVGYCTYTMEFTQEADMDMMSNRSKETASDVLKTCLKLRASSDFKKNVNEVVQDVRGICGAQGCGLMLVDTDERKYEIAAECFSHDSTLHSIKEFLNSAVDYEMLVETWKKCVAGSDCIIVKNDSEMEYLKTIAKQWYDQLVHSGVRSIVLFPLNYNDTLLGFLWAANFDTNSSVRIKETLELTTFFLAADISNHHLLGRLEKMSTMDMLTGVFNRNAMNDRIAQLAQGEKGLPDTIGIVYADLNGLKNMNDTHGHNAGDAMLRSMADILRRTFSGCSVYRAGGDEFVILAENIGRDEFARRVDELARLGENGEDISFAVGSIYCDRRSQDIQAAIRSADEMMYANKQQYYELHPERRHRTFAQQ